MGEKRGKGIEKKTDYKRGEQGFEAAVLAGEKSPHSGRAGQSQPHLVLLPCHSVLSDCLSLSI